MLLKIKEIMKQKIKNLMSGDFVNYHEGFDGKITSSNHKVESIMLVNGILFVRIKGIDSIIDIEHLSLTENL